MYTYPILPAAGINQQWYCMGYGGNHLQWTNQSKCHHLTDGNFTDGHQVRGWCSGVRLEWICSIVNGPGV